VGDKKRGSNGPAIHKDLIRELADLLTETELSEIEIEQSGLRLRVARQLSGTVAVAPTSAAPAPQAGPAPAVEPADDDLSQHPGVVNSPMVGTIYLAPEPGAATFIKVGQSVSEGDTLLIVEAMKTMNHIPAPRSGVISRIIVEDGQPIEFGEPLVIIE
jgi:acetyl-CoA carboxylase biotin carboxyl carrier protein